MSYPCGTCGSSDYYRSIGTRAYCWEHFWREMIPRRRRFVLKDLGLPDNEAKIGHFIYVSRVEGEPLSFSWVKCSLCGGQSIHDPWHSLGYPCSACVEKAGAAKRLVLLPPPMLGSVAATLEQWAFALRQAIEAEEVTHEEAMNAWKKYEHFHE